MSKKTDCIVVGGGVIGMTTARALAQAQLKVRLLDKGVLGQEASWAAGGILSSLQPWLENSQAAKLSAQGQACYQRFVTMLQQETGIDVEYYQCGLLMINALDIVAMKQWVQQKSIHYLDDITLTNPLNIPAAKLFLPNIAQIRVPRLLKALRASLAQQQVIIHENTPVTELPIKQGYCNGVRVGDTHYHAEVVIVTAGAWSSQLLPAAAPPLTITPIHGQMLGMKWQLPKLNTIVLDGGYYLIPRLDGYVLIGSTVEAIGFQKRTTAAAKAALLNWATKVCPDMTTATLIQHWSGLRPATDAGSAYVKKLGGTANIFINAGHFRKGILQAPVCAANIVTLVNQYLNAK